MITDIEVVLSRTIRVEVDTSLHYIKDHSELVNLDYEHSGHTGFASKDYVDNYHDDTKVDKLSPGETTLAYVVKSTGTSDGLPVINPKTASEQPYCILQADKDGYFNTKKTPSTQYNLVNKNYVDNYHDSSKANDSDVVHNSGNEDVYGIKTFKSNTLKVGEVVSGSTPGTTITNQGISCSNGGTYFSIDYTSGLTTYQSGNLTEYLWSGIRHKYHSSSTVYEYDFPEQSGTFALIEDLDSKQDIIDSTNKLSGSYVNIGSGKTLDNLFSEDSNTVAVCRSVADENGNVIDTTYLPRAKNVQTGQYKVYINNEGVDTTVDYRASPVAWNIAQYDANACLTSSNPSSALQVVNKQYLESRLPVVHQITIEYSSSQDYTILIHFTLFDKDPSLITKDNLLSRFNVCSLIGCGGTIYDFVNQRQLYPTCIQKDNNEILLRFTDDIRGNSWGIIGLTFGGSRCSIHSDVDFHLRDSWFSFQY